MVPWIQHRFHGRGITLIAIIHTGHSTQNTQATQPALEGTDQQTSKLYGNKHTRRNIKHQHLDIIRVCWDTIQHNHTLSNVRLTTGRAT